MEVDWNVITGQVITAVLKIVIPFFVLLVLKWASELWLKIKGAHPQLADILSYAAEMAVEAAEQILGPGKGAEKKEYAIQAAKKYLAELGLDIDVDVIADAIEQEVYQMNKLKNLLQKKAGEE